MSILSRLIRRKKRCHKCGRTLYLRTIKSQTTVASGSDPRIWQTDLALECSSCRKITCTTCARKAALSIGEQHPICPTCNGALR